MNNNRMRYGIVGLGSIGTVFSVLLKQAGYEVVILEKFKKKVDFAKTHSIKVAGELKGEAGPFEVYEDVKEFVAREPDVVLICTKNCDSLELLKEIKECQPPSDTVYLSCQNGFDVEEQIVEVFGKQHALRMVLNIGCGWAADDEVRVLFCFEHYLSDKEVVGSKTGKIAQDFDRSGLKTKLLADYRKESYKKAILNSAMSSTCAVTGWKMKEAMNDKDLSWVIKTIIQEAIEVAEAIDLGISKDYFDEAVKYLAKGGSHKPSMLVDIENGRKTENEYLCGKIYKLAEAHSVKAPVIQTVYYLIKGLEKTVMSPA